MRMRAPRASGLKLPLLCLLLVPLAALAVPRQDYARQWPLQLENADSGAYRVMLPREVYLQAIAPDLADATVANADGVEVPAALFDAAAPLAQPPREVALAWFPLPAAAGSGAGGIAAISEIGSDGSLRRVELRPGQAAGSDTLIDASQVDPHIVALHVDWAEGQAPFERRFSVAVSDDLKAWRTLQQDARLIELENAGQRLLQHRIELPQPQRARYLRLQQQAGQPPLRLSAVRAELAPPAAAPEWQWQELAGRRVSESGVEAFEFVLDGRFPMQVADVALADNSSREWSLSSRDDPRQPWMQVAPAWLAYQVQSGNTSSRSPPQPLYRPLRHRYWRLQARASTPAPQLPRLRLGYRPEVLVFLAQGRAPYALLAGSGRARRTQAPLPQLLEALRTQRGSDWQPATATAGAAHALAGEQALQLAPAPRDWKAWLLWALLLGGALLVAGFAFSLLRQPRSS